MPNVTQIIRLSYLRKHCIQFMRIIKTQSFTSYRMHWRPTLSNLLILIKNLNINCQRNSRSYFFAVKVQWNLFKNVIRCKFRWDEDRGRAAEVNRPREVPIRSVPVMRNNWLVVRRAIEPRQPRFDEILSLDLCVTLNWIRNDALWRCLR